MSSFFRIGAVSKVVHSATAMALAAALLLQLQSTSTGQIAKGSSQPSTLVPNYDPDPTMGDCVDFGPSGTGPGKCNDNLCQVEDQCLYSVSGGTGYCICVPIF